MGELDEALQARAQARLGSTLNGKYRLDRVLGIGGMATVYAATHRNQAELAVKVLHQELSVREDLRKRFLREGYVGNSVKHPGAVLVVDDDVAEDGSAFLVMELLRGWSLEDLWEREGRRLSSQVVTALTLQLLDVLGAAHEKAIVHRDLKPANLFLSSDGSLKVLDFGIARLRDAALGSERATQTGALMGTPAFMAPEQAQAITTEIDGQTDLWAVGATMFTLLSGQLVHEGDNGAQLLIKAATSRARQLLTAARDVDPALAAVVDQALTFEKAGRFPTAEAMRDALLKASSVAHGRPAGRASLVALAELTSRSGEGVRTDRTPVSESALERRQGGARVVVGSGQGIQGNDPTFATPVGKVLPPLATAPLHVTTHPPHEAIGAVGARVSQRVLPGVSTANPVSAEAVTLRQPAARPSGTRLVVAAALLVAGSSLAFAFTKSWPTTPDVASASARAAAPTLPSETFPRAAPPVAPAFSSGASNAGPNATTAPATATPGVAPGASVVATDPGPPPPASASASAVGPAPRPVKAASRRGSATRGAGTPECGYTLDEHGNKKWDDNCR